MAAVRGLYGEIVEVDAPPSDVELRLDGRILRRLVELRLCLSDRLAVDLGDQPDRVVGKRFRKRLLVPRQLRLESRNVKAVRLELRVLLREIAGRAGETLGILWSRRPDDDAHAAIVS